MPPTTAQNDDYVVSLLLRDAEANKKRYLTNSLGASLRSSSKPGNAPKPNTRFLRNVIRETDSHNAALKAKEEEDSKARLRELRNEQMGGKRRRDDEMEEGSEKRRRRDDEVIKEPSKRTRREEKVGRWASAFGGLGEKSEQRGGDRRDEERSERRHSERHERPAGQDHTSRKRHTHAPRDRYDRSEPIEHKERPKQRRRLRSLSHSPPPRSNDNMEANHDSESDDSDPLATFLGPKPPPTVLPRGRGAYKPTSSSIDTRFKPSYNPKTDVDLSPAEGGERDDWDMALEALRDRAKWRVQGSKRLREAGFTEEEVGKWEESDGGLGLGKGNEGMEKGVEDVKWRKHGEGREWDRGKVVDELDGSVDLKPEWGRLKGA